MTLKKIILIPAALMAVSLASCKDNSGKEVVPKTVPDRTDLRIMSFNVAVDNLQDVKGWSSRKTAVYNMLSEEKPTVIGFQEAQAHEITGMLKECPEYTFYGLGRDTGVAPLTSSEDYSAEETMAVFWIRDSLKAEACGTFWLSQTPSEVSYGWDASYRRTLTWVHFKHRRTGAEFFVFNTHLDNKGTTARKESMKLIMTKMAELNPAGLPTFLMADFNAPTSNAIFTDLLEAMYSARDRAINTESSKNTYNGYTSAGKSQIDHIFYRGRIYPLAFRVLDKDYGNTYISDHYPIVCDCYIKLAN